MTKTVTVLGTGLMGAGMARNLADAGLDVTVWNRNADKARPLAEAGATVAEDLTRAVSSAEVIVTMLFDADAVAGVMEQALPAADSRAVWVQSSTVGVGGTAQLAELAEQHGVGFVDAPVLGTKQPAEQGTLTVLAGGPSRLRDAVSAVFEAIGSNTIWVGEQPGDGHRLKLVANSWVLSVVGATAQAVGMAEGLDIDPRRFLEAISGGPLDCAYTQLKGDAMIKGEFPASFTLGGAVKDTALIAEAMRAGNTDDRLMWALNEQFQAAVDAGYGSEDMAAVVRAVHRSE
ncbi:3-hydroxyisobutyrate dehydrogenase [Saccharopolyspora lacisalsi]|uniref:3-hydroxyisobutyrate dehydrogenase n=1 Tax=Halosaccharopolyspora lacisalsi TaxID=1000566 RepID=A0A839E419_9PSEU|nr:NAD(P)-dependent oxidoreductase [Halosaccharopolyspora lacisalsi]MBA8826477.1 3-hydroxyisobutyrate dehydrogenase [Halosaccharopolyspora lacisalsi]